MDISHTHSFHYGAGCKINSSEVIFPKTYDNDSPLTTGNIFFF